MRHARANYLIHVIVVKKSVFNNWIKHGADKEYAFYQVLTYLLARISEPNDQILNVICDKKNNKYDKHHEVVQIIGNRIIKKNCSDMKINTIVERDSKQTRLLQLSDLWAGAICHGNILCGESGKNCCMSQGKKRLIRRIAEHLGWQHLGFDTWPNQLFNIWKFPIESRAEFGKSKNIMN